MKNVLLFLLPTQLFILQLSAQSAGSPDNSFGQLGIIVANLSTDVVEAAECIAVQPDGKILVGGISKIQGQAGNSLILLRYKENGLLDSSFGVFGKVYTDLETNSLPNHERIKSIEIQPDGKILAGGYAKIFGNNYSVIVRYLQNGSLDESFGSNGVSIVHPFSIINVLKLLPNGKVLTAGQIESSPYLNQFAIMQFLPNGKLDSTFANNGLATFDVPGVHDEYATDILLDQGSGGLTIAGVALDNSLWTRYFTLVRFHSNGVLDTNYKMHILPFEGDFLKLVYFNGTILAAGGPDFQVLRLYQDGSIDETFGENGRAFFSQTDSEAKDLVVLPDGQIIVAGHIKASLNNTDYAIVCYSADGEVLTTFGNQGIARNASLLANCNESINAVALQSDGKIIGAGYQYFGGLGNRDISLVRFWGINGDSTSSTQMPEIAYEKPSLSFASNIVRDHFECSIFLPSAQLLQINLLDLNGHFLDSWKFSGLFSGKNGLEINLSNAVPQGVNFLRFQANEYIETIKLIKID